MPCNILVNAPTHLLLRGSRGSVFLEGDGLCSSGQQQIAQLIRPVCRQCSHLHPVAAWIAIDTVV